MKKIYPPLILIVVTFAIFTPSSLFLGNIDEFAIDYLSIVPILAGMSTVVAALILAVGIVFLKLKISDIYSALLFGVGLGLYIQGNFLNPDFGVLNGREIDWSKYLVNGIISSVVWLVCVIGVPVILRFKKDLTEQAVKWGSLFLSAIQIMTLVVLLLSAHRSNDNNFAVTKDGEFNLSKAGNVIVFVVDTLDEAWAEEYINSDYANELKDFTFYDNVVAGGAPTELGIPLILTGESFDTKVDKGTYYKEAYEKSDLFKDMNESGYKVKLYTEYYLLSGANQEEIDNTVTNQKYVISDYWQYTKNLYKMVGFYSFPQVLKAPFWFYGDDFSQSQTVKDKTLNIYKFDDAGFYEDFKENGIEVSGDKTFVMYHLTGAHVPYSMNENCERVSEDETSLEKQLVGVMKILTEYMEELKKKGIYENSTIIITADHGGVGLYENPAVYIKKANVNQDRLVVNSSGVTFENLYATLGAETTGDLNKYKNRLDNTDLNVRYHVAPYDLSKERYGDDEYVKAREFTKFKIVGNVRSSQISVEKDDE